MGTRLRDWSPFSVHTTPPLPRQSDLCEVARGKPTSPALLRWSPLAEGGPLNKSWFPIATDEAPISAARLHLPGLPSTILQPGMVACTARHKAARHSQRRYSRQKCAPIQQPRIWRIVQDTCSNLWTEGIWCRKPWQYPDVSHHSAEVLRVKGSSGGGKSQIQPLQQPQPQSPSTTYHVVVTAGVWQL